MNKNALLRDLNAIKKVIAERQTIDAIYIKATDYEDLYEQCLNQEKDPSKIYALICSDFILPEEKLLKKASWEEKHAHMSSLGLLE
jgi:RNA-binding protein YlmH